MSGNRRFVDASILVYAHDESAGAKRDQARTLLEQLWESREGCLSVQVLQEFFVNVTRKIAKPLGTETAEEIVADFSCWHVHVPAAGDVLGAIGIHQRTGISLWEAMIVRAQPKWAALRSIRRISTPARNTPGSVRRTRSSRRIPAARSKRRRRSAQSSATGRGTPPTVPGRYTRRGQRAVAQLG